jgi:hypothetical protein
MHIPFRHCCVAKTSLVACPPYPSTCNNRYKGLTSPLVFFFSCNYKCQGGQHASQVFFLLIRTFELGTWWIGFGGLICML